MRRSIIAVPFAILISAIVFAPAAATLWLSWRAIVVGALVICTVLLLYLSVMAAAGTAWQPSSGNPYVVVAVGWTVAAVLAIAAFVLAGRGIVLKIANVVVGTVVVSWAVTLRHHVGTAWWVVAHPERPSTLTRVTPRPSLVLRSANGSEATVANRDDVDVIFLAPGTDTSDRLLALLDGGEMMPFLRERSRILVVEPGAAATALHPQAMYPTPAHPLRVERVPSFYDRETGVFGISTHNWMIRTLHLPVELADGICLRYFGELPKA